MCYTYKFMKRTKNFESTSGKAVIFARGFSITLLYAAPAFFFAFSSFSSCFSLHF